ncbi:restriction endonuclease subunit S [Paenibacillus sp. FSL K6-0108]|uniref:restriction endonuclease subunit S n=1 Tax=Paenibacillus sp. FSL K6-0108 TaxID=2921417 RepID=UPI003246C85C
MRPLFEIEKTSINIDWKVLKIKRVLDIPITDGPHETPELLDEGIPFLSAESVKKGKLDFNLKRGYISREDHKKYIKKCKPQRDDIFMIKSGATTGNVAMVETDEEFSIWSPLALIRADKEKIIPKYLYYFIGSSAFREQVEISWSFGTQQNIGMKVIENLFLSVPSLHFQEKLVQYMESKVVQIDKLIEMKGEIIHLLEQQRQSIITESVTKGLNPDVKMKDSGVEWIGEIPEHWEVKRLKNVLALNPSKNEVDALKGLGVTFLPMENILAPNEVNISITKNIEEVYSGYTYFKNNDLVVAKVTPCFENGNIAVMQNLKNSIGFGTTELHVLRAKPKQNIYFYFYLAQSAPFKQEGVSTMYGVGGLKRIPSEFILNYKFAMPSVSEQNEIVEFLNEKCTELECIKKLINGQIEKLKEYRQSLIYEAVTGKIDVRDMELD